MALKEEFHMPVPTYHTVGGDTNDCMKVTVEDFDLCPRYMGRVVKTSGSRNPPTG